VFTLDSEGNAYTYLFPEQDEALRRYLKHERVILYQFSVGEEPFIREILRRERMEEIK